MSDITSLTVFFMESCLECTVDLKNTIMVGAETISEI